MEHTRKNFEVCNHGEKLWKQEGTDMKFTVRRRLKHSSTNTKEGENLKRDIRNENEAENPGQFEACWQWDRYAWKNHLS